MATVSLIKGSANTGPSFYLSSSAINSSCQSMQDKVNTECGDNANESKKSAENASLESSRIVENTPEIAKKLPDLETAAKKTYGYEKNDGVNSWIEDHCYGLWLKPMGGKGFASFTEILTTMRSGLQESVLNGSMTSATADPKIRELSRMLMNDPDHADNITSSSVLAEMMSAAADANPCIRARRCILVPYKNTEKRGSQTAGAAQAKAGDGCCPGQTGHHILPGAMFGPGEETTKCDEPYEHSEAPVICVEGTGNKVGNHGTAHLALQLLMDQYKLTGAKTISYEDASALGIEAVQKVNPECTEACLQAQLDAYYKEKLRCSDAKLKPHSGMAETGKTSAEKDAEKALKEAEAAKKTAEKAKIKAENDAQKAVNEALKAEKKAQKDAQKPKVKKKTPP
ncbi:hypothetical protein INH39_01880 [Massilia violaceinigra]|uniref:Tox-GHH2 domain-containing protein n=1 Tax=Massilia violaceinigra TaxID=2045208 RepID=A0ABY4AA22_9BURK|nr:HNH/endonuclease VII fold toxin-2 domain-containing protein [Massilia violaceinigra]UOD30524.1 hypothetical protein INH39_01880 [Massilia violaceinigra]